MHFISILNILIIYYIILQLVRMYQKINISIYNYLFSSRVYYIFSILAYLIASDNEYMILSHYEQKFCCEKSVRSWQEGMDDSRYGRNKLPTGFLLVCILSKNLNNR